MRTIKKKYLFLIVALLISAVLSIICGKNNGERLSCFIGSMGFIFFIVLTAELVKKLNTSKK
jgi:hypothetical protein